MLIWLPRISCPAIIFDANGTFIKVWTDASKLCSLGQFTPNKTTEVSYVMFYNISALNAT